MAEEKLIHVNLQLPASELAGLTALVEQLQGLLHAGGSEANSDRDINSSFDETRFHSLADAARAAAEIHTLPEEAVLPDSISLSELGDGQTYVPSDASSVEESPSFEAPHWAKVDADALSAAAEKELSSPAAAGFSVSDDSRISFIQHGNSAAERLITAAPAPLTAEAVSLAFRRDDRRYDNGFPLY